MEKASQVKRISNLGLEDLSLDWDGVDQCRNCGLGALNYLISAMRAQIDGEKEIDAKKVHFFIWMLEDHLSNIDSFLERLFEAMKNKMEGFDRLQTPPEQSSREIR